MACSRVANQKSNLFTADARCWKLVDVEGAFPAKLCESDNEESLSYDPFFVPRGVVDLVST